MLMIWRFVSPVPGGMVVPSGFSLGHMVLLGSLGGTSAGPRVIWVCVVVVRGLFRLYLKLFFGFVVQGLLISIQSVWVSVPCAMSWFWWL